MTSIKILIGQLSKRAGVPAKTIRYYEDIGLLSKPKRTISDYRTFTQDDVDKLLFIKKAKELGLTLKEIKEIMFCSKEGLKPCCNFVRDLFEKKINEYENRIVELNSAKRRLKKKLNKWVKPKEAKRMRYSVCPQIEKSQIKKGGKKNEKKKR